MSLNITNRPHPEVLCLLFLVGILFSACTTLPQPLPGITQAVTGLPQPPQVTPGNTSMPPVSPTLAPPINSPNSTLAFLSKGDIWLTDVSGQKPAQLTSTGDIQIFTWSRDGNSLATFNGHSVCFVPVNPGTSTSCQDLPIQPTQDAPNPSIAWSPDQKTIVVSIYNHWYLARAGDPSSAFYLDDPAKYGVNIAPQNQPGAIAGEPLFLPDNTLIGSFTHPALCGSGGCHYTLFRFDSSARVFKPFLVNITDYANGGKNLSISNNGKVLANTGNFCSSATDCTLYAEIFRLDTNSMQSSSFDNSVISEGSLSPEGMRMAFAGYGPEGPDASNWAKSCGLSDHFIVTPLQLWDLKEIRINLPPGRYPSWSSNGLQLAFSSCLAQDSNGNWNPTTSGPPKIYILAVTGGDTSLVQVAEGSQPAWSPAP